MPIRAACNSSSWRCADALAVARVSAMSTSALLARELGAIIVGGIAVYRVNMIDAALRRVLNDQRGSLDAEIRRAAVGGRPAPREIGVVQVRLDLPHSRLGDPVCGDAD